MNEYLRKSVFNLRPAVAKTAFWVQWQKDGIMQLGRTNHRETAKNPCFIRVQSVAKAVSSCFVPPKMHEKMGFLGHSWGFSGKRGGGLWSKGPGDIFVRTETFFGLEGDV